MDSYSGSEPRLFISFRLGIELNGQPTQSLVEERMDTSESFVTAISGTGVGSNEVEVPKESGPPVNETTDVRVNSPNLAGAEPDENQPKQVENDAGLTNSEVLQEDIEAPTKPNQLEVETTPNPRTEATNVEGSSTDESCSSYIARKWQQLGEAQETPSSQHMTVRAQKESESMLLQLAPNQEQVGLENKDSDSVSEVAFLDSPVFPTKSNLKSFYGPSRAKIQRLSLGICDPSKAPPSAVQSTEGPSTSKRGLVSEHEPETSVLKRQHFPDLAVD